MPWIHFHSQMSPRAFHHRKYFHWLSCLRFPFRVGKSIVQRYNRSVFPTGDVSPGLSVGQTRGASKSDLDPTKGKNVSEVSQQ